MPIREITIDKIPDARAALSLIQGEGRAQIVRFVISRNEGGVDLSGLQWMVRAVNAVGDSDVYMLDTPTFDDKMLTVDWLVHGVATAVAGETRFELQGVAEADGPVVWKNGTRTIKVYESLDAIPSEDDEQLTALQTLILHVRNELEGVIAAGQAAGKAAAEASNAAEKADAATASAISAAAAAAGAAGTVDAVKDDVDQLKGDLTKLIKKSDNYELFSLEAYTGYTKELRKSQAGHTYIAIFTKYSGIVSIRNLVNGSWKEMSPVMTVDTCLCGLTVTADGSIRVNAGNLEYNGEVYLFDVTGDPELQSYLEINGLSGVDKVVSGIIPDIESEIEEINKKFVQLTGDNKCVCCWGDSITQGAPVYGVHAYPAKLANLLGDEYTVMEYGVGGETPHAILARMGAYATYAEPFTMPASGSVDLDLKTVGLPIGWRYKGQLDKGINPVIIEGVEGTIVTTEPTSGNWVYTFTRTDEGESKAFDRPVFVSTHGSRKKQV